MSKRNNLSFCIFIRNISLSHKNVLYNPVLLTSFAIQNLYQKYQYKEKGWKFILPQEEKSLAKQGVNFCAFSIIFKNDNRTIYNKDKCCYYNKLGYDILTSKIAKRIHNIIKSKKKENRSMKFKKYLFCIIFLILNFLGLLYQKRAFVLAQTATPTPTPTTGQTPTNTPTTTKKPTDTPTPTRQEGNSPSPTPTKKQSSPTPVKKRKRPTSTPYPSLSPTTKPTKFPSPTIEPTATPSGFLRSASGNFLAFLITIIGLGLLGSGFYLSKRSKGGFRRKSRLKI